MASDPSSSVTVSPRRPASFAGRDADRTVVWLRGEHDISTVAALSETMAQAMALDDSDLVLDLSEVQFMSAATVGVIVRTRAFLRPRSRSLALRSPSTCARRILDVCGVTDLVDPRPIDLTRSTRAGALGTWVTVLATDRVNPPAGVSPPTPSPAIEPVRAGSLTVAGTMPSAGAHHRADERTTNVAGREGP